MAQSLLLTTNTTSTDRNYFSDEGELHDIGVKYAREGMHLRQHRTGEEKGIEPYDNH
jgi:hypothetical protein